MSTAAHQNCADGVFTSPRSAEARDRQFGVTRPGTAARARRMTRPGISQALCGCFAKMLRNKKLLGN
jgi:hypothetical protein